MNSISPETFRNLLVNYDSNTSVTQNKFCGIVNSNELKIAIAKESFHFHLQPKASLQTCKLVGAEALIRWNHKLYGKLGPESFLPIANYYGLMSSIDMIALRQALILINVFDAYNLICPISINVSVDSLSDPDFDKKVFLAIDDAKVDPCMIEIEIPEYTRIHNLKTCFSILSRLSARGIKISLDDFGTGYSTFSYLKSFPIDTIKIDKMFIDEIDKNRTQVAIVSSVIGMSHALDIDVVAEGAETIEEFNVLKGMNCDTLQGYYYASPMDVSKFLEFSKR